MDISKMKPPFWCPLCDQTHQSLFCPPQPRPTHSRVEQATCDHPLPWTGVGRCVYCDTCRARLYQGSPAKDEEGRTAMLGLLAAMREKLRQEP